MNYWNLIRTKIKPKISEDNFRDWFEKPEQHGVTNHEILVRVPSKYYKEWIPENFSEALQEVLQELEISDYKIRFLIATDILPAENNDHDKAPSLVEGASNLMEGGPLNPKYTFQNFVIGSSNNFAHAAARAVAERPAFSYNPLYLYGGVGLGKTHLMHAIGHHLRRISPHLRVVYMSSERFMNEMISCVRYQKMPLFREKYRDFIDVLLMDDIQFMRGKTGTQEEFFHTFNALYDSQKQIVISSDCLPKELDGIEERLQSRFEWGLIADIKPPELETRILILQKKAEKDGISVPEDVIHFIARNIKANIRELEGNLTRLLAYADLMGEKPDLILAKRILLNIQSQESREVTITRIQKVVADHFKIKPADIISKNNAKIITEPRQIAMYLCKKMLDVSLPTIGREFGGKHHTTVLYAIEKIQKAKETDQELRTLLNKLKDTIE